MNGLETPTKTAAAQRVAIEEADVIVCVFDGVHGPTDADRQAVELFGRRWDRKNRASLTT